MRKTPLRSASVTSPFSSTFSSLGGISASPTWWFPSSQPPQRRVRTRKEGCSPPELAQLRSQRSTRRRIPASDSQVAGIEPWLQDAPDEPDSSHHEKRRTGAAVMRRLGLAAAIVAAASITYELRLRRPILTWGATDAEATARLPGDELLEDADGVATRAITIDAPASDVWPWIAQMGPYPRGGAYTYDWIENLLGLNMHSVREILPEYQTPKPGDGFGLG